MDLHQLDILINEGGVANSAEAAAIGVLLKDGTLTLAQAQPLFEGLFDVDKALRDIQAWSKDAQKPAITLYEGFPVTRNPDGTLTWNGLRYASEVDIAAGKPVAGTAPVAEKLPRLTDPQLSRLLHVAKTAQYDQALADELGANYNAYVNAYSVGGYYYDPAAFAGA